MIYLMLLTTVISHMIYVVLICFSDIVHIVKCVFSFFISFMKNNNFWRLILLFYQFQNVLSVHYHDVVKSSLFLLQMTYKSVLEIIIIFSWFSFQNIYYFFLLFFLWIYLIKKFFWFVSSKISLFRWFCNVCISVIYFNLLAILFVFVSY